MKKLLFIILFVGALFAGWETDIGLGVDYKAVNKEGEINILSTGESFYSTNEIKVGAAANIDLTGKSSGWVLDYGVLLDGGYNINKIIKLYLIGSYDSKQSLNLKYRVNAGFGGKITYFKKDKNELSISLIPLYNLEEYGVETEGGRNSFRLSFRSKIILGFFENKLKFKSVMFYKPLVIDGFENYILDFDNIISYAITDKLSVEAKHLYDLEHNVIHSIDASKTRFIFGFRMSI